MRVFVQNVYTDRERLYEGSQDMVRNQLLIDYPFLRRPGIDLGELDTVLHHLASQQALLVEVEDEGLQKSEGGDLEAVARSQVVEDLHGLNPAFTASFRAAKFLGGGWEVPYEAARRALWAADGDLDVAALQSYGFDVNEQNLAALR